MLRAVVDKDRDGLTVSIEDLRFEWIDDEPGWIRNLQVWEIGDQFVASLGAWHEPGDTRDRAYGEVSIHPDWREPVFVDEIMQASILSVSELIARPVRHRLACARSQVWLQAGLERAGYAPDRYFHRMSATVSEIPAAPALPGGFSIRPFAGDTEIEDWVAAFNGAFADHYDPPTTTVIEKRHRMTEAGYLAEADLVLVDARDTIVGIGRNSSEKLDDGSDKGWVHAVALLPDYRGRGLGRALLLASMAALRDAGFDRVHLSVDSDNRTGAQQLYTAAGFTIDSQMIVHVRPIDPA